MEGKSAIIYNSRFLVMSSPDSSLPTLLVVPPLGGAAANKGTAKKKRPLFRPGALRRPSNVASKVPPLASSAGNDNVSTINNSSNNINPSEKQTTNSGDELDLRIQSSLNDEITSFPVESEHDTTTIPIVSLEPMEDSNHESLLLSEAVSQGNNDSHIIPLNVIDNDFNDVNAFEERKENNETISQVNKTSTNAISSSSSINKPPRRRPISLSRLEAAKKMKKTKAIGVPIGRASTITSSSNVNPISPKRESHSIDIATRNNIRPSSGPSDSRSIVKVDATDKPEKPNNIVDLSHHPSIRMPPVIPENPKGMPTMASFCIKALQRKRGQRKQKKSDSKTDTTKVKDSTNSTSKALPTAPTTTSYSTTVTSSSETPAASHTPAVQIVNGEIVLKETSLEPEITTENALDAGYTVVEEETQIGVINASYSSFLPENKRRRSNVWNLRETLLFYSALKQVGLDFETMEAYFQQENEDKKSENGTRDSEEIIRPRTRKQLKRKYHAELLRHPDLIEKAMDSKYQTSIDLSIFQLDEEALQKVEEERKEEAKRRELAAASIAAAKQKAEEERSRMDIVMAEVVEEDDNIIRQHVSVKTKTSGSRHQTIFDNNNASMWSIFEDGPPPDVVNEVENENNEDADFDDSNHFSLVDPLFTTEHNENDTGLGSSKENVSAEQEEMAIALVPTLGGSKSSKKKVKPNFRSKIKK